MLSLLLLAACAPAAEAPGNTLTLGVALEPPGLDPTSGAAAATDEIVYANVFEGLTRIAEDGSVQPALARSWSVSPDGLTYTFALQPGVRFHDGTAFDTADVRFSLERAKAPDSTNAQKPLFEPIAAIETPDPLTVRIRLSRPDGGFLFNLGWGDAVMVAPESAPANAASPVGTGPFRFVRWRKGAGVDLARNADYWGPPARLDAVHFQFIADPSAAYAALLSGDVDGFPDFPAPELLPQIARDPRFVVTRGTTEGETILAINNRRPFLDDVRVRRAIGHAIDRASLIEAITFGDGVPIGSPFPPHNPAYVDLTATSAYDPALARRLLAEAGWPADRVLSLRLPPVPYARRGGEIIAAQLRAVGVQTRIENIEWAQWLEQVFTNADFDLTIVAHTEPNDIAIYARPDYYFGYAAPEFQALMARLDATSDPAARAGLLQDAQRMLARDAVNAYLYQLPRVGAWSARVKGQWANAPVQANDLTGVRLR